MEIVCSDPNTTNTKCLGISLLLALFGEWVSFFKQHSDEINAVGTLIQWFAWFGAGLIGLITFFKFLQENGWIRKGKPKYKIRKNENK